MMSNNDILKKLRVALQLRDDQIVEILQLVNFKVSKAEIGALFRNEDHPNFKPCGDQILRNFLNGLVIHLRGPQDNKKPPVASQLRPAALKPAATTPKNTELPGN